MLNRGASQKLIMSRAGADMDYHIICPRDGIIDDDAEVDEFLMTKVLPKFVDVVHSEDVFELGNDAK